MAVKNALPCDFHITAGFDGYYRGDDPTGSRASGYQTAPTLLATDINSGSTTGGENNKGSYLTLFGYSFGRQADLGTAAGARVYLRDSAGANTWVEVDNYRSLMQSRTYAVNQAVRLVCQVGALGSKTGNLDIKVTVNGVDTNILLNSFYVQPGDFYFVDNVSGNDGTGTKNNIALPYRYLQYWNGSAFTGIWATGNLQGGDTIVIRGGTYTDETGGVTAVWCRHSTHTFDAATGVAGHGSVTIVRYPGPALGHAPEDVFYNLPSGARGGIFGANGASAALGKGTHLNISGLRIASAPITASTDSAPINMQFGCDYWRVFDCDTTWPTTAANLGAGITGQGRNFKVGFNYVHDIGGVTQNHGMYFDDCTNTNLGTEDAEIYYNWIEDCSGGSGIQFYGTLGYYHKNNLVHHNVVDTCSKHGINYAEGCESGRIYSNIVLNTQNHGIRLNYATTASTLIDVIYNTVYNCILANSNDGGAIENDGTATGTTAITIKHNIVAFPAGRANTAFAKFYGNYGTDTNVTLEQNLYHDAAGTLVTLPAKDATYGIIGNPLFTAPSTGDFTFTAGSPAIAAATRTDPFTVSVDFFGIARPGAGTNDIGATQGVGT